MVEVLPSGEYAVDFQPGYFDKAKKSRATLAEIQTPLRKLRVTAVYDVVFEIKP